MARRRIPRAGGVASPVQSRDRTWWRELPRPAGGTAAQLPGVTPVGAVGDGGHDRHPGPRGPAGWQRRSRRPELSPTPVMTVVPGCRRGGGARLRAGSEPRWRSRPGPSGRAWESGARDRRRHGRWRPRTISCGRRRGRRGGGLRRRGGRLVGASRCGEAGGGGCERAVGAWVAAASTACVACVAVAATSEAAAVRACGAWLAAAADGLRRLRRGCRDGRRRLR
jgi:hypothetical protein